MHYLTAKPRITIDVGPLFEDQWTGIPVFTRRLIQSLMRHGGVHVEFCYNLTTIPHEAVFAAIQAVSGAFLRTDFERRAGQDYPLVETAGHVLYPSVKEGFEIWAHEASTVHDLSTLVMPENHDQANVDHHMRHLARELQSDEVVFCVSEATREALCLAYPSSRSKARILYQYVDWPDHFETIERHLPPVALGRYAAVIGTVEPRKNLTLLIDALPLPAIKNSDLKFIVIGKIGWKVDKFLAGLAPRERQHLIFSGFVTEFIKYRFLKHAEFLVFPSMYEGFGIPALEAMSLGKPVLAAMSSSFPEVIGDAGVYFDPLSTTDFVEALREISSPEKLAELKPKAIAGAAAFNWQRMAQPVVEWLHGRLAGGHLMEGNILTTPNRTLWSRQNWRRDGRRASRSRDRNAANC